MHLLADSAGTNIGVAVFWVLVILAYWVPSFVAGGRHVPNTGSIVVINLFLGWTVVGWVVALAMAVRTVPGSRKREASAAPKGPTDGYA